MAKKQKKGAAEEVNDNEHRGVCGGKNGTAGSKVTEIYRGSQLGRCLAETLEEMLATNEVTLENGDQLFECFDVEMQKLVREHVEKDEVGNIDGDDGGNVVEDMSIKGQVHAYNSLLCVWKMDWKKLEMMWNGQRLACQRMTAEIDEGLS